MLVAGMIERGRKVRRPRRTSSPLDRTLVMENARIGRKLRSGKRLQVGLEVSEGSHACSLGGLLVRHLPGFSPFGGNCTSTRTETDNVTLVRAGVLASSPQAGPAFQ